MSYKSNILLILSFILATCHVILGQTDKTSYTDLQDVMENCKVKAGETYEQSCVSWYNKFKAQIELIDEYGRSPLYRAIERLDQEQSFAEHIKKTINNPTELCQFTQTIENNIQRRTDILKTLIKAGANLEATDKYGHTALHDAVNSDRKHTATLQFLIEAGANLNTVDKRGYTPLHTIASQKKPNLKALEMLIAAGADVNAQNKKFRSSFRPFWLTPLDYLWLKQQSGEELSAEQIKARQILIKNGAKFTDIPISNGAITDITRLKCILFGGKNCELKDPTNL